MNELEKWLLAYETDVRYPNVSGMEHLDMLLTRSNLANRQNDLTNEQRTRLSEADRVFLNQAHQFYEAIAAVADVTRWRVHAQSPKSHWWWYLDVLVYVPWMPTPRIPAEAALAVEA